jgi:hypothetical protein
MPLVWTDYGSQGDMGWAKAGTCRRTAEKAPAVRVIQTWEGNCLGDVSADRPCIPRPP